jgi:hypothetical protein
LKYSYSNSYIIDGSRQIKYYINNGKLFCNLSTLNKNNRTSIELSNNKKFDNYIKIILLKNKIELHKTIDTVNKINKNYNTVSININYKNLFTTSNGNYGTLFSNMIYNYISYLNNKYEIRNSMLKNNYLIYKNNLGTIKLHKKEILFINNVKSYINKNFNSILKNEKPNTIIINKINKYFIYNEYKNIKNIPRKKLIYLSYSISKYINNQIKYKSNNKRINILLSNSNSTIKA